MNNKKYYILLFLVSPLLAFYYGLLNFHSKNSSFIILCFLLFYSFTYIPIPNSDATRYEERIQNAQNYNFSKYTKDLRNIYSADSLYHDVYVPTLFAILTPFTNNPNIFRLLVGLIYFSTYLALLKAVILTKPSISQSYNWFVLGIIFLLNFSIGINGVRWPLALLIFLLGSLSYIKKSDSKYILLCISSFFIHFILGYLLFFFLLFIATQKYYNPKLLLLPILITFIFSSSITSEIKSSALSLNDGFEKKIEGYTSNDYQKNRQAKLETKNWYIIFNKFSTNYFVLISLILTTYVARGLKKSTVIKKLEYFSILMLIASFLSAQLLHSSSNRYYLAANGACLIYLYLLFEENQMSKLLKSLNLIYAPIVLLDIAITFRSDLYTVSPNLIFGNIFIELFYSFDISIQTLITGREV